MRVVIIAALLLTGCASSSGVFETAPGIYSISSTAITSFGGSATARGDAYKKAQAKCATAGKQMELVSQDASANIVNGSADLTFKCV